MIAHATLQFLGDLSMNNDRSWFDLNRGRYEAARQDIEHFTAALIKGIAAFDPTVGPDVPPKSCMMRIYRDVRFSKNKTPYRTNFGIAISGNGKNFPGAGYYIQIEPGKSFVAAGAWQPAPEALRQIRQEIDYNGSEFLHILENAAFRKSFGKLSDDDKLKTMPKGYAADHKLAEMLKLKSFIAERPVKDTVLTSAAAGTRIVEMFETLAPFLGFLRNAIA